MWLRCLATKLGRKLRERPGEIFDRKVEALLSLGPLESLRHPNAWNIFREVHEFLDEYVVLLLTEPYVSQRRVAYDPHPGGRRERPFLDVFPRRSSVPSPSSPSEAKAYYVAVAVAQTLMTSRPGTPS